MLSFPKYESYKDSGVEWIGEIPSHWSIKRLKFIATIKNGQDYKLFETSEPGYPVIGSGGQFTYSSKYLFKGESVLLGRKGTIDKPLYINEAFWTVDTMFYSQINRNMLPKFFYYCALNIPFKLYSTNTAIPSVTQKDLSNNIFACPPVEEQRTIVEFLDRKTAEIDQAIEQKQRLIKLLKEQKAILIDRAVTKGLNPNVPMRDSGVDWIGEIPRHWNISKIGFVASVTKLTGFEYTSFWKTDETGEIIALRGFNIGERTLNLENTEKISLSLSHKLKRSRLKKGDLVVPCTGTLGNASVIDFDEKYHINQNIAKVSIENINLLPSFLCYWMTSNLFREKIDRDNVSGMQPVLLIGSIRKLAVVLPSVEEQELITQELDKENQSFDVLINKESEFIEILKELKSIIISNSVTGKVKI